ncbi:lactate utilization protein C [Planctomycetota bacterium]
MEDNRNSFLKNISEALQRGLASEASRPTPDEYAQARLVPADAADLADRFARWAEAEGMYVYRLKDRPGLIKRLLDLIGEMSLRKLLVADDPELKQLGVFEALKNQPDIDLLSFNINDQDSLLKAAFAADGGIGTAAWALAETGALVLTTSPTQPRLLHLVPPVHICVVTADRIKADLLDLLLPENLAGCVTLMAGPSKTSDIEMKLVTGVHGPTAEYILLLE